jgi:hypothetical protein
MESQLVKKTCGPSGCKPKSKKIISRNGKGDKIRPFSKSQYNNNYESIDWSKKK